MPTLSKCGSSAGAEGSAGNGLTITFTRDYGVWQYGDICMYGTYHATSVTWAPLHDPLASGPTLSVRSLDGTETGFGTSSLTLTVPTPGGDSALAAPGIAFTGGDAETRKYNPSGTSDSVTDGNLSASGASPRSLSLASHSGLVLDIYDEFVVYNLAWGSKTASFPSPALTAISTGTDLGQKIGSGVFAIVRSSYELPGVGGLTASATASTLTWTGGGTTRGALCRMIVGIRHHIGGVRADIRIANTVPNLNITADVSHSFDPDTGFNDVAGYSIDWGDGSGASTGADISTGTAVPHTYAAAGTYRACNTVTDLYGATDVACKTFNVGPVAPDHWGWAEDNSADSWSVSE